jgi:hypothetical protein
MGLKADVNVDLTAGLEDLAAESHDDGRQLETMAVTIRCAVTCTGKKFKCLIIS